MLLHHSILKGVILSKSGLDELVLDNLEELSMLL